MKSFTTHRVDPAGPDTVFTGCLPDALRALLPFEVLWDLHPAEFPVISLFGPKPLPRWQQAFRRDYHFSGHKSAASPVPGMLAPLLGWVQETIDPRLNGLLLNWYDGTRNHYIGAHHDSLVGLVPGSPFVTVSLGDSRTFRFSRKGEGGKPEVRDFPVGDGSVIVFNWETNLHWKHQVPHFSGNQGRRVSVTLRAFTPEEPLPW